MINTELSNIWSCVNLPNLLSSEKELFDAHLRLRRNQPGFADFLGWLGQGDAGIARLIGAVNRAADAIVRQGQVLVVAGMGESWLGARAAVRMLKGAVQDGRPSVIFVGNQMGSEEYLALFDRLEGKDFCLQLIMPDRPEPECAIASRAVRWMMERRYGKEAKARIFVTALPDSPMATMAKEEGYPFLAMPTEPGGGVSALTAATLLPLTVAGIDPLAFLEGAAGAYGDYDLRAFENPVWMYAGARYALTQKGRSTECLGCFTPDFGAFGAWWQQYFLRHTCREGAGAMPVYLPLPSALDAMDTVAQGKDQRVFETLLQVPERCFQKVNIEMDWKDYDGLGFLAGKTLLDAQEGSFQAVLQAHTDLDVPVIQVSMQTLDAAGVGELFYFFELAGAISACACGVDPFDGACAGASRALAKQLLGG